MSKTLDEILDIPTRYIHQHGCACTRLKRPSECDCNPTDLLADAKQAILQWVNDEVVGYTKYPDKATDVTVDMMVESGIQAKQRDILKQHGWKEQS